MKVKDFIKVFDIATVIVIYTDYETLETNSVKKVLETSDYLNEEVMGSYFKEDLKNYQNILYVKVGR